MPTVRQVAQHLLVGGVGPGEGDVVADRPVEQERLLGHHTELATQRGDGDVAQVVAVEQHRPRVQVVEAGDQLGDGGLARAGRAHEGDRLARFDVQVDVVEHGLAGDVAEAHVAELDGALQRREVDGVGGLGHPGLGVEQVPQLGHRRLALLVGVVELDELLDGGEEGGEVEDEGGQLAQRQLVVEDDGPADGQDQRLRQHADGLGAGSVDGADPGGVEVGVAVLAHDVAVAVDVVAAPVVGHEDPDAREALLQVGQHVGDAVADHRVAAVGGGPEPQRQREHHRHDHDEGDQRQLGVEREEDGGDHDQGEGLDGEVDQAVLEQLAE